MCKRICLWNVLIFLEILRVLYPVSRLKRSLKDTANPKCNQLLASLYKQSSTEALAPEKERGNYPLLRYKSIHKMDLICHLAGNKNCSKEI